MTVIAGVRACGVVHMAADGKCLNGRAQHFERPIGKLFRRHDLLIGVSGSLKWGYLLCYAVNFPSIVPAMPPMAWFNYDFADFIRGLARKKGLLLHSDDIGDNADLTLLIGYAGELYYMATDFSVTRIVRDCHAIGSGNDEALGALCATRELLSPVDRLKAALNAVCEIRSDIGPPFMFEQL